MLSTPPKGQFLRADLKGYKMVLMLGFYRGLILHLERFFDF